MFGKTIIKTTQVFFYVLYHPYICIPPIYGYLGDGLWHSFNIFYPHENPRASHPAAKKHMASSGQAAAKL
jgi:hypothetical protein